MEKFQLIFKVLVLVVKCFLDHMRENIFQWEEQVVVVLVEMVVMDVIGK